ncbi:hypothetical protein Pint_23044 [Pistacia integerrima]|uniref:Uncharacterized protein n=1 Tax=Pistacia integerrima TaxID=434235 RepID=A0ACC0YHE9_9ROSI|nr:hypothetical protein Pint_23044 [Pistacia integerrima]
MMIYFSFFFSFVTGQASILKKFPAFFIIMLYLFLFNTILSMAYSLIVVTDLTAWKLRLDIGLVAILYSPLAILFSVVMDIIFLAEPLRLGGLIGAVIIVAGFYAVMWGKLREESTTEGYRIENFIISSEKVPLLQNKIDNMNTRSSCA